jgi:hypothetical protein
LFHLLLSNSLPFVPFKEKDFMEAVAYFQLAQDYESPELLEANLPSLDNFKVSRKVMAASVTGAALVGGSLVPLPALAYHYGCCKPVSFRPVVVRPIVVRPVFKPVCYQPSCYPQGGHDVGYYPEEGNHYPDYEQSDCNCSGDSGSGGGYDEIAFFPEHPNFLTLGSSGQLGRCYNRPCLTKALIRVRLMVCLDTQLLLPLLIFRPQPVYRLMALQVGKH